MSGDKGSEFLGRLEVGASVVDVALHFSYLGSDEHGLGYVD